MSKNYVKMRKGKENIPWKTTEGQDIVDIEVRLSSSRCKGTDRHSTGSLSGKGDITTCTQGSLLLLLHLKQLSSDGIFFHQS